MILKAGCTTSVWAPYTTPLVLILRPQSGLGQQVVNSSVTVDPPVYVHDFTDAFGNYCQRVTLEPGFSTITSHCTVDVPDDIDVHPTAGYTLAQDLPDDVLQYLLPSRYCPADLCSKEAQAIVKGVSPGYDQAEAIRTWIQKKIKYKYGVSNASTTALDTYKKKAGVCRDFAHLGISFCRAIRIPARFVYGYLHQLDPMDLHAWFEAFVGGRWYTFDATQKTPKGNRIVVGYGRDAVDVAQITEFSPLELKNQYVFVEKV